MPRLTILLIDHDPRFAAALQRGLMASHYPIIEHDIRVAHRRLLDGEWFDAVVCEANMPELSGHQLCAATRSLIDRPIFVLTSRDAVQDANADATLRKPFPVAQLLDLLTSLGRRRATYSTVPLPRIDPRG